MENVVFENRSVYSDKLGRDIELSCYSKPGDDKVVVTSKSLETVFNEIKIGYGATIDNSDKPVISFAPNGEVVYVAKYVHLTDSEGYDAWEVGESTPKTRLGFIAENHPLGMAESRAKSKAIRKYLGLPLAFYSSDEIQTGADGGRTEIVSVLEKLGRKAAEASSDSDVKKDETPETAEKPAEKPKRARKSKAEKPEEKPAEPVVTTPVIIEEAEPESVEPAEEQSAPAPAKVPAETAAEASVKAEPETQEKPAVAPEPAESAESGDTAVETTEAQEILEDEHTENAPKTGVVDEYNGSLLVTFGPGKGKTVAEVLNDPACRVFVEKIKSGSVVIPLNDPKKAAVIKAIAAS